MTPQALYQFGKRRLEEAGIDTPAHDTALLITHFFGMDRTQLLLHGDQPAAPDQEAAFLRALHQRAAYRPLQYILGTWPFMNFELAVGEGVLVPRPETELLVRSLADVLGDGPLTGADLCAGSGAVALGLSGLCPNAHITAVELSEAALFFLRQNTAACPAISVVAGDVTDRTLPARLSLPPLDFIAANPPYVTPDEWATLSPEVHQEPAMALLGGADGLSFYRDILHLWSPLLKKGGILAFEIGDTQASSVSALLAAHHFEERSVRKDFADLDRVVIGRTPAD